MRSLIIRSMLVAVMAIAPAASFADTSQGTADEAKAMVERAVARIKEAGPEKAFAEIDDPANKDFHDRDLYVFVRSMDGNTVAHGVNKGMIGHTSLDLKDADGKLYNKEMIDLANSKGSGWVDYRWPDPVTKKVESKSSFIEKVGEYVVGVGIYKP